MTILYTHNNKLVKINNKFVEKYVAPPPPPPSDEVTIGTQTWKIKNLAIDDGQGGINIKTVNYGHGDVVEYYYLWDAAVRVAASVPGWHLPSKYEWDALIEAVGGSSDAGRKLKSSYGWSSGNGTDDYGFTALPAGLWRYGYSDFGTHSYFWTATARSSSQSYYTLIQTDNSITTSRPEQKASTGYTVRLIKDS